MPGRPDPIPIVLNNPSDQEVAWSTAQFEHAEFLVRDQDKDAQQRMLGYIDAIEASGDLPLLDPKIYARSVSEGRIGNYSTV